MVEGVGKGGGSIGFKEGDGKKSRLKGREKAEIKGGAPGARTYFRRYSSLPFEDISRSLSVLPCLSSERPPRILS